MGLTGEEEAIEGYWDTIILLLDRIRAITGTVFAGYRNGAQGRSKPDNDEKVLKTSAERIAATAGKSMNWILEKCTEIKREVNDFEDECVIILVCMRLSLSTKRVLEQFAGYQSLRYIAKLEYLIFGTSRALTKLPCLPGGIFVAVSSESIMQKKARLALNSVQTLCSRILRNSAVSRASTLRTFSFPLSMRTTKSCHNPNLCDRYSSACNLRPHHGLLNPFLPYPAAPGTPQSRFPPSMRRI